MLIVFQRNALVHHECGRRRSRSARAKYERAVCLCVALNRQSAAKRKRRLLHFKQRRLECIAAFYCDSIRRRQRDGF